MSHSESPLELFEKAHAKQIALSSNPDKPHVHKNDEFDGDNDGGERDLTESQEETMRLLEEGANRTLETAPAPPASPRLPIERS
jgi:hypothetical protein